MEQAIHKGQLNDQGDGTFTVTILDPRGIVTRLKPNYVNARNAIMGDIYSAQPNGDMEGREAGANGSYEKAKVSETRVTWAASGFKGVAIIAPYAGDIPNV